jgi:hypothetical protein
MTPKEAKAQEPMERQCQACGDKIEDPNAQPDLCYGCWCAKQIKHPRRYMVRERYQRGEIRPEPHPINPNAPPNKVSYAGNATKHPKIKISFLDMKRNTNWGSFYNVFDILEMRWRERQQGLEEGEYWNPTCIK